jgi:hypothetical protein
MTDEEPGAAAPRQLSLLGLVESATVGAERTAGLRARAESLGAQVGQPPRRAVRDVTGRLLEVHRVAAAFYRAQLHTPDHAGPAQYLRARGVSLDGAFAVGYAPNRPTALVNDLRRRGFGDAEILASGLASTGSAGQLIDRFRDRVMIGVRDHRLPGSPVVGFIGQAPPGAGPDVPTHLRSPTTAIHRPGELLLGLAEQQLSAATASRAVIAADPLDVVALAHRDPSAFVVAPATAMLTPAQGVTLTDHAPRGGDVFVAEAPGGDGRAMERAYQVLAPVSSLGRVGQLLTAPDPQGGQARPLVDRVVESRVARAAGMRTTQGRAAAARAALAVLADQDNDTRRRLGQFVATTLGVDVDVEPTPVAPVVGDDEQSRAAEPTPAPPQAEHDPREERSGEPLRGARTAPLADGASPPVRPDRGSDQLLLDLGGGGSDGDRDPDRPARRAGSPGGGLPEQGGPAQRGRADGPRTGADRTGAPATGAGPGQGRRPGRAQRGAETDGIDPTHPWWDETTPEEDDQTT